VQLSLLYGRELAPNHTRYMAGLLTTGYAVGQLIGPMTSALSTWLTQRLEPALGWPGWRCCSAGFWSGNVRRERYEQFH
jgi:MFS family permease